MLSYPYILGIFSSILAHSKAIKGRVFYAPYGGGELNSPNLNQLLADTILGTTPKTYPLALFLTPVSDGDFAGPSGGWENYTVNILFLKQQGRDSSGNIQAPDTTRNVSTHTVLHDHHDMRRVAVDFMRELKRISREPDYGLMRLFRISEEGRQRIVAATGLGNDKLNGVLLTFRVAVFEACVGEDYPTGYSFNLPVGDQHPYHPL